MGKANAAKSLCASIRTAMAPLEGFRLQVWIGGGVILGLGVMGLLEAWRLITERDPTVLYDPLGPGWYIMVVAGGAVLAGSTYLVAHLWGRQEETEIVEPVGFRLVATIGLSFLYAGSIYVFGYFISTILFLTLQYRVLGIESWVKAVPLGVLTASVLWLVFVHYSDMIFPPGIVNLGW